MNRVALIALFMFTGTAARGADPAADEVKKLQGEWQAIEVEINGKKGTKDDADVKALRLVIKDDAMTLPSPVGDGKERKKTFKLDPSKSPKEIDITSLDGQEKDQTAACIYKLDGDRLTICMPYFTKDPSVRPKEFKAGANDGIMLITLERVKAK
jgi:RNA polymerase sigma-70 factor (ECF subfamily)